jgi:hypothetical protein
MEEPDPGKARSLPFPGAARWPSGPRRRSRRPLPDLAAFIRGIRHLMPLAAARDASRSDPSGSLLIPRDLRRSERIPGAPSRSRVGGNRAAAADRDGASGVEPERRGSIVGAEATDSPSREGAIAIRPARRRSKPSRPGWVEHPATHRSVQVGGSPHDACASSFTTFPSAWIERAATSRGMSREPGTTRTKSMPVSRIASKRATASPGGPAMPKR